MIKKIAIVTGASRGVGERIAKDLAAQSYHVILIARNKALLESVCDHIQSHNGQCEYFAIDVSDHIQVKTTIEKIVDKYHKIDLLVNNAAILARGTTDMPEDKIEEIIKINLNGAIFVAKHVANQMKKQKEGYIMNISSLGGKVATSFAGVYSASKFGLSGFSEALTKEMALYNVKVTNICPSMIATDMASGRKFPLEAMIQLEDISKTIDYLLSLSPNAIPTEILISCLPLIKSTTEMMYKMYLD